jgi:hypothetical protein
MKDMATRGVLHRRSTRIAFAVTTVVLGTLAANGIASAATGSPYRQLTDGEQARAQSLATQAPAVTALLVPRAYTVASVVPWYRAKPLGLLGAVVTLRLSAPQQVSGQWRFLDYNRAGPSGFGVETYRLRVNNTSSVLAFVDLMRGEVAGVVPDDRASIADAPAGFTRQRAAETGPGVAPPLASGSQSQPGTPIDVIPNDGGGGCVCPIYVNGNRQFWNFDFQSQSTSSSNTDWPVNLIFANHGNINRVKTDLSSKYDQGGLCADPMYNRVGQNFDAMVWDSDQGRKYTCCPITGGTSHFRIYAPPNASPEAIYSTAYGYYVVGTSHRDVRECGSSPQHGWSEDAEYEIGTDAHNIAGYGISRNLIGLNNGFVSMWIGNHYYQSNGWATRLWIY